MSRRQLLQTGLTEGELERRLERGSLHRLHRGVYAAGHTALTRRATYLAAVLAAGEGAVLSHESAAALWSLRPPAGGAVEVSVLAATGRRDRHGIRVHRTRRSYETHVRHAIPVTGPLRTLVDIAPRLTRSRLRRALDEAAYLRLLDADGLRQQVRAHRGEPGAAAIAAILAEHEPGTALTRTELEAAMFSLCERGHLPRPLVNARVLDLTVDFLWPGHGLVVETDGAETHLTRRAFEDDRDRDQRLTIAGYRVVRFTWRQLEREPRVIADRLRRLITPR